MMSAGMSVHHCAMLLLRDAFVHFDHALKSGALILSRVFYRGFSFFQRL
jgi:hypothetical protein